MADHDSGGVGQPTDGMPRPPQTKYLSSNYAVAVDESIATEDYQGECPVRARWSGNRLHQSRRLAADHIRGGSEFIRARGQANRLG